MDLIAYSTIYNSSNHIKYIKKLHCNILIQVYQVSNLHKNKAFNKVQITLRNVAKWFILYREQECV